MGSESEGLEWIQAGFPKGGEFRIDDEVRDLVRLEELRFGERVSRRAVYVKVDRSRLCRLVAFSLEGFEDGLGGVKVYLNQSRNFYFIVDMNNCEARPLSDEEVNELKKKKGFIWLVQR